VVRAYARRLQRVAGATCDSRGIDRRQLSYRNVPLRIVALRSDTARLDAVLAKLGGNARHPATVVPGHAVAAATAFPAD
jgi:hypothetical protein